MMSLNISKLSQGQLGLSEDKLISWYQRKQKPSWHSFDQTPWKHPWLSTDNLAAMREFSLSLRQQARTARQRATPRDRRFGFVCNVANSMYTSAKAIRAVGAEIDLILHPGDDYLLSQPEWEEFDGEIAVEVSTFQAALAQGIRFPSVPRIHRGSTTGEWTSFAQMPEWVSRRRYYRWRDFYSYLPVITKAREYDCLFVMQCPYLAYLSDRPYIATHMGGDIWYDCSRDDLLGQLQRHSFTNANLFIASNPWSYAFARRYGMKNMAYIPTLLNAKDYSPGHSSLREQWQTVKGGNFFVLTTARIDNLFKGSQLALEAFSQFSATNSDARLVLLGWGADLAAHEARIEELGLVDKFIIIPPAGKQRVIGYLRSADCLLDQFVLGYFGMTALEALACGIPVIARLEVAQYDAFSDAGCPPVMNASTPVQIADALTALYENSDLRHDLGRRSRDWFMRYSGNEDWAEVYLDILVAAASGYKFDFLNSPLTAARRKDEIEYERDCLREAPIFPNLK